jgi:NAD(P)-dependent dehydrogenase (short-subunit alcohol dehydrogenase family)
VAVNYTRDAAAADRVAADVRARGRRAITVAADVADEAQVLAMFRRIDAELGPLDGLVNNAGVVDQPQRVDDMSRGTPAPHVRHQHPGQRGVRARSGAAHEHAPRRRGGIVNLSSAAARLGSPGQYVDYAASKGAIDSFTLGLAREVAAEGIRVNACARASSTPTSTPAAACPTARRSWPRRCR